MAENGPDKQKSIDQSATKPSEAASTQKKIEGKIKNPPKGKEKAFRKKRESAGKKVKEAAITPTPTVENQDKKPDSQKPALKNIPEGNSEALKNSSEYSEAVTEFKSAEKAADQAREAADQAQGAVSESFEKLKAAQKALKENKEDPEAMKAFGEAQKELTVRQTKMVEARKEATKKAEEELVAAQNAEVEATEAEAEAAQQRVDEAQKKLTEAQKAEAETIPEIISDIEEAIASVNKLIEAEKSKPADEQNHELIVDLQAQSDSMRGASAGSGNWESGLSNLPPERPMSAERMQQLGECSSDGVLGAGQKYLDANPKIKWVLGAGHPPRHPVGQGPDKMPSALDCSGFVSACLRDNGINICRTSRGFFADCFKGERPPALSSNPQSEPPEGGWKGALLFKGGGLDSKGSTSHVAFVTGPPQNGMLPTLESCSSGGGVVRKMRPMKAPWYCGRPPYITA